MTAVLEKTQQRYYTPDEYLALEESAEYKSEYHDGQIIPMTGGTINHNRLALNMSIALRLGLKGKEYDVFIGDVKLWIPEVRRYTYPDVMVIASQPEFHDNRKDTITNPQVIIEVLSKSTRNYDRGDKFDYYKTLPTFQEYILIEQSQVKIAQYFKTDTKRWSYREYDEEDTALSFNGFELEVPLMDIYEKVDFTEEEDRLKEEELND
ncbi:Uma2 family endonuclease [Lusitaniella coriacea]|uniref:Uma2 family endonuclease n=1 Tax=Lusitaniella coriacea TaxID=1983105 RepID=UPI003CF47E69